MGDEPNIMLSQRLSVMFMVLAIGCLMDIRLPSYSIEAEKYHQLARAALFQNNIFDEPTLGAVQALYLMSFYLFFSDKHGSSGGSRWAIMGMAVKLAQSVSRFVNRSHWAYSLTFFPPRSDFVSRIAKSRVWGQLLILSFYPADRDTGRWKLDLAETQRRREVFWELYVYDSWQASRLLRAWILTNVHFVQCLTFGRPPAFTTAHVDCKMPFQGEPPVEDACQYYTCSADAKLTF